MRFIVCSLLVGCTASAIPQGNDLGHSNGDPAADGGGTNLSKAGFVSINSDPSPPSTTGFGFFWTSPVLPLPDGGTGAVTIGPCTFSPPPDPSGAATIEDVSAGEVTISNGATTIAFQVDASGTQYSLNEPAHALWNAGDSITFAASGADVPAFSHDLIAPSPVTIEGSGGQATFRRDTDLALTWTGTGGGDLSIAFVAGPDTAPVSLGCSFAIADGHGVIPAAALSLLPPGAGSYAANLDHFDTFSAGDWQIDVDASTDALASAGGLFSGTAQFE